MVTRATKRDDRRAAQEIQDGRARGFGRLDLLEFEFLRPSDHGRQTNWSIRTMIATITPNPQMMERVSPALAAVWR